MRIAHFFHKKKELVFFSVLLSYVRKRVHTMRVFVHYLKLIQTIDKMYSHLIQSSFILTILRLNMCVFFCAVVPESIFNTSIPFCLIQKSFCVFYSVATILYFFFFLFHTIKLNLFSFATDPSAYVALGTLFLSFYVILILLEIATICTHKELTWLDQLNAERNDKNWSNGLSSRIKYFVTVCINRFNYVTFFIEQKLWFFVNVANREKRW